MSIKPEYYLGMMSGTSLDGIDVALVDIKDSNCQLIATHFVPYPESIKDDILKLHFMQENELELSLQMGNQLAKLYAQAVQELIIKEKIDASEIKAIGNHGQTIRHRPEFGFTLQIGNSALLAELTQINVVSDFRSRDIAANGQGAPLVPAFHKAIFGSQHKNRAIINIGGIANISYLAKNGAVTGFDSGPGNMLIDSWTKLTLAKSYDANGAWAATGIVDQSFLDKMLAEPYFALPPPKSTGRDLFNDSWLKRYIMNSHCSPEDIARTLVELTTQSISQAIFQYCANTDEVFVCGGGAHNGLLLETLSAQLKLPVQKTDVLGVGVDWVEAVAFAWLAKQCLSNQTSNLPEVTGAKGFRILGAIYPK